jgi:hypothetical protein
MAERTDPDSPSADSIEDFSFVASSLLNRLNTDDTRGLCAFDLRTKGVVVLREREAMKEVDGEEAARRAARRMRCLELQLASVQLIQ